MANVEPVLSYDLVNAVLLFKDLNFIYSCFVVYSHILVLVRCFP